MNNVITSYPINGMDRMKIDLVSLCETACIPRNERGRFAKGSSGNPAGRPKKKTGSAVSVLLKQHDQHKQAKQVGRPFQKGQSGNPQGRPPGARSRAARLAEALLAGEAEALIRKMIERALAGDPLALKLCADRLLAPLRERAVQIALPALREAGDIAGLVAGVAAAAAEGELTPGEAGQFAHLVDTFLRTVAFGELERRLQQIEAEDAPPA
jgi:hypothetical protein